MQKVFFAKSCLNLLDWYTGLLVNQVENQFMELWVLGNKCKEPAQGFHPSG